MVNDTLLIKKNVSLKAAIAQLDEGGRGVLFIVDENDLLVGILTDGDVRRAILNNADLNNSVTESMNRKFTAWPDSRSREDAIIMMKKIKRRHMPIINSEGILVDIVLLDEISFKNYDNTVIIMAGGLGSRLGELTKNCPKPLLAVGDRPILETILENFINQGFRKFYLAVNYKAEMIESYFGNGERWGIQIKYLREEIKLGTAGALGILPDRPDKPIIVMNGDLITKVDFQHLIEYHLEQQAKATVCVRQYETQVPFGVLNLDSDYNIKTIEEKPVQHFFVNAGIYILDPSVLELITYNQPYDMPIILQNLIKSNQKVCAFPIMEYWMDIGRVADFERANSEYKNYFS